MDREITNLRNQAIAEINEAKSLASLEDTRARYLGRKGTLAQIIKKIKNAPASKKKPLGILVNETKSVILSAVADEKTLLKKTREQTLDLTVPGIKKETGHLHLITQTIDEIERIFRQIGFVRKRYPEVEWDWYAFESLGFGPNHPARDEWETFLVDEKPHAKFGQMLLTPHTSSGQVHEISLSQPPIRMINIGKTYRRQSDATHTPMFHQFEGLAVDKNLSISHLRGTLEYFTSNFFGTERKTRIRPYNFPFTEPSFEVDVSCKSCKAGWLEIGGAGMVHPDVLKNGGVDPGKYSGFAFGWGVERVAMMKAGIDDLRQIYSTDVRYLKQF